MITGMVGALLYLAPVIFVLYVAGTYLKLLDRAVSALETIANRLPPPTAS